MRLAIAVLSLCMSMPAVFAGEPLCGTSLENDERVRGVHERVRARGGVRALAEAAPPIVREGAFYVQNDESITPGYRPFDLAGQTLVFTPADGGAYSVKREALRYSEPPSMPLRDFQTATGANWHYVTRDLARPLTLFGRSASRIYVTAFNGIHIDAPGEQGGMQFDALEAAVHRTAVVSPLMITTRKPRFLEYPKAYVEESGDAVTVTWRSTGNAPFGYDVQAELRFDGTIAYSYRTLTSMRWGTPLLSPGFDPATATRTQLAAVDDSASDVSSSVPVALREMLNIRRTEVFRLRDSDLFAVRIQLAQPIDRSKLADGEVLGYQATIGIETASVEIRKDQVTVRSFTSVRGDVDGATARFDGNVVEIYGIQQEPERTVDRSLRVAAFYRPLNRIVDSSTTGIPFTPAARVTSSDFSSVAPTTALSLPIAEPFVLGIFDPFVVWDSLKSSFALSDYEYDGVAMYQTYYTDMIFYAGAYSTGGNPQVDGIAPYSPFFTTAASREPSLLHMNQLGYNYSTAEETASKVMLHEFGHRWLYFFQIREGNDNTHSLNPSSGHPAAYVHTPSAFPVYGPDESSTMGGGFFTQQGDGTYKAHAANMGYSWTDLYLMGLAAPEEVPPWFYLAGTNLPTEYWPNEGQVTSGEKREVKISQITQAHGPRNPSPANAQRKFKVLFVLVTEEGVEPTAEEVAKLNGWRALMEKNFALATGNRGRLVTTFVRANKQRAVR
jgi:hypothetical protein